MLHDTNYQRKAVKIGVLDGNHRIFLLKDIGNQNFYYLYLLVILTAGLSRLVAEKI